MTHQFSTQIPRRLFTLAAALLFAISITACSDSPLASVPLSPSALPSSGVSLETADATAVTDGWGTLGKGNDKDKGKGKDKDDGDADAGTTATSVEIEGIVATVTGACPSKTVTVGTKSFATNASTVYADGTCADLVATKVVEVKGTKQADGTVLATKVEFEGADADEDDDGLTNVEGSVASVTGTCPAITIVVTGRPSVVTSATTQFRRGVCADVKPGTRVHMRGTLQTNGSVAATRVDIKTKDEDDDEDGDDVRNPHDGPGPFEGTVSELTGVCPVVTFNLRGMEIVTSATTTYTGGTCATLRPNVQVVVTGTRVGDTRTINATKIEITRTH